MKYCLNIEDSLKTIVYRLDKDKSWKPCNDFTSIQENHFTTNDRQTILDFQIEDEKIEINNKEYKINSTEGIDFFAQEDFHYTVYGFREDYPNPPIRKQLEEILLNGNDSRNNTLVLKTDSKFYLVDPTSILFKKCDPEIVFQFEGFRAGNGYVGETIKDHNFEQYTEDLFRTGMHYWRNHLVTKELHEQSDSHEGTTIDDLLDIYDDLEKIKNAR